MSMVLELAEALRGCVVAEEMSTSFTRARTEATNNAREVLHRYEAEQKARAENMANANTKDFLNQAAKAVHARLPDNFGFIVFAFPYDGGRMLYASNAERKSAVNALKEWLLQASGEEEWLKHIQ